jgi:IS5 family transposase
MAEIGLVRFARLALEVSQAVLPAQRTKFSKRLFTQPQLLAVLCLMRYEDWTFREAEVRLSEHSELRSALQLKSVPDYTTLYRFLVRLDPNDIDHAMDEVVRRMPGRRRRRATVGVDATGLAQGAVSSYFIRRVEHFGQPQRTWKHWLKWLTVVDLKRQLILTQGTRQAPWNDCATLPALVTRAHQHTPIGCVLADAEFDSERNHTFCRQQLKANSVIPAKRRSSCRASGVRLQMREHFPSQTYALRALIESVFSAVKRKLSARAPGRSFSTQSLQALLLGLAFNLYRLRLPACYRPAERMSTEPNTL